MRSLASNSRIFQVLLVVRKMAKTRASVQSTKSSAKLNIDFVGKVDKGKKRPPKTAKNQFKTENTISAAKLQSQIEKKKKADLEANEQLLKLCRPMSICLMRIKPHQTKETSVVKSKFIFYISYTHIVVFV